jgi:hypothetical protein
MDTEKKTSARWKDMLLWIAACIAAVPAACASPPVPGRDASSFFPPAFWRLGRNRFRFSLRRGSCPSIKRSPSD